MTNKNGTKVTYRQIVEEMEELMFMLIDDMEKRYPGKDKSTSINTLFINLSPKIANFINQEERKYETK